MKLIDNFEPKCESYATIVLWSIAGDLPKEIMKKLALSLGRL